MIELHGFYDASKHAYAGVGYLRMIDSDGSVHFSLVTSKTKVAPIKCLTIPRLELYDACLLVQLLHYVKQVFNLPGPTVPLFSAGWLEIPGVSRRTLAIESLASWS